MVTVGMRYDGLLERTSYNGESIVVVWFATLVPYYSTCDFRKGTEMAVID